MMEAVLKKPKEDFVDLVKGITMLFVILTHTKTLFINEGIEAYPKIFDVYIHTMFLPIFYIISGLFYSCDRSFGSFIRKKTKRLIVPYLFFYIFVYLINCMVCGVFGFSGRNEFSYMDIFQVLYKDVFSNSAIWFLLSIFWSSLMMYPIVKFVMNVVIQIITVAIIGFGGMMLGKYQINIPLYVDTSMTILPIVYIGYQCKQYDLINRLNNIQGNKLQFLFCYFQYAVYGQIWK